ncbi:MAG: hypothetical protein KDB03_05290 [Planctomycetales bacterium]|nr:hypothetical protein [Planctomycetales bacterium]
MITLLAPRKLASWTSAKTAIGIDIGQFETKIVALQSKKLTRELAVATVYTFEDQSEEATPSWNSKTISALADRIQLATKTIRDRRSWKVRAAISMEWCDYRSIFREENSQSLAAKLGQALQDTRPRTIVALPDADQKKIRVFSTSEEQLVGIGDALHARKLTPESIDGIPWCLYRARRLLDTPIADLEIILDWSFGKPTLVCVADGKIQCIRRLCGGLGEMSRPQMTEHHLSIRESIRWLQHTLSASEPKESVGNFEGQDWINDCCSRIADQLNTSIEFMQWKNPGKRVSRVWLTGGGAETSGLVDRFQALTTVPIHVWQTDLFGTQVTPKYAVAVALAMKGL